MANFIEVNEWAAGVRIVEPGDKVLGGLGSAVNLPFQALANRTLFNKNAIAAAVASINSLSADKADKTVNFSAGAGLTGGGTLAASRTIALATPSTLSGSTANWAGSGATGHTHALAAASPTLAGVLKVLNVLTSSDNLSALSALQGKVLADMIAAAIDGAFNFNGALGARDLDSLDGSDVKNYGVWYQTTDAAATADNHYPIRQAGCLLMLPGAYRGMQVYISYSTFKIYHRYTNSSPVYSAWRELGSDKLGNTGEQELNGTLRILNGRRGKLYFPLAAGEWRMEFNPDADSNASGVDADRRLNLVFTPTSGNPAYLRFNDIGTGETVAYQSWVNGGLKGKVSTTDLAAETAKLVTRRNYTRTITGTADSSKSMSVAGNVTVYPDGRIVQIIHVKDLRVIWFGLESAGVGFNGSRHHRLPLQLWTAMPNAVTDVRPVFIRATNAASSQTYGSEAAEWVCAWSLFAQGGSKSTVNIDASRFRGGSDEPIDLYVVIEGY